MAALMRVPAADLRGQHDRLRAELLAAFNRVLDSSAFIQGVEVEAFEREFAAFCDVRYAVALSNGTDALALALRATGVGPGHAVAVPAFTFAATAEAVCHVGAHPLLIDIDPQTFTLDADALRRVVRDHTGPIGAVIAVHLYGQPASMDEIGAVARECGATLIEDAAQAHGAHFRGRRVGGLGRAACFSFYPSKNLGALGDAGAVTTDDGELAAHIARLRDHGQTGKYAHAEVGFNCRMDGLQAALLRVKLSHLERWNARRQALAALYRSTLAGVPRLHLTEVAAGRDHVYHLFVIRCEERDGLAAHLHARGIAASVHYPAPLHLQPAFAFLRHQPGDFPVAESAAREVIALPIYPELSDTAVLAVCDAVRAWAEGRRP